MTVGSDNRKSDVVDAALMREAFEQFVLGHEEEVRRLVMDVLEGIPELMDRGHTGRSKGWERYLDRLVRTAIDASPLATQAVAPGRALALFPSAEASQPLAPARAHAASRTGKWEAPELARGERLESFLERDPHPLPATADREGYHDDRHLDYWLSGLEDFLRVRAALARHGRVLAAPFSYLDFGCASGRVLRHFVCQVPGLDVWGTDLNEGHVNWLLRHLPGAVKAFQCTALPFLPLQDESLDLVTAFSVFTHIDEFETAWLLELRRALRPGGMAYVTVHTDDTWGRMKPGLAAYDNTFANRESIPEYRVRPELFQAPMPREKTVFRWRSSHLYNTNVFLSKRHIRDVWGRFYEVLEIIPQGSSYQDVIVLRKPA